MHYLVGVLCVAILCPVSLIAQATIRVHVKNAPANAVVSVTSYSDPITWTEITLDSALLDAGGKAVLHCQVGELGISELHVGEQYAKLFLENGMSLDIDVDYSNFDSTIAYGGPHGPNQTFLLNELLHDFQTPQRKYSLFNDGDVYGRYIDSVQKSHFAFYRNSDTTSLTPSFREFERKTIEYQYYYPLMLFGVVYNPKTQEFSSRPEPQIYFDRLKTLNLKDEFMAHNSDYITAVDNYINAIKSVNHKNIRGHYDTVKNTLRGKVRDVQLAMVLRNQISTLAEEEQLGDSLIADFRTVSTTPQYTAIIDSLYAAEKQLAPGKPLPNFSVSDSAGGMHSLRELRGKVVYVDIWAAWCLPCVSAMKDVPALRASFDTSDVAFTYISYNDSRERWLSASAVHKLGPRNWYADENQSDIMRSKLSIFGIPRYLIIDRNGKIINSNASGPGSVEKELRSAVGSK